MTPPADEAVARLAALRSDVASALYALDSSPDLIFVRAQAGAGNLAAKKAVDDLATAWERYPLANQALDKLEEGLAAGRRATVDGLLGRGAVHLPDGRNLSIEAVLTDVRKRATKAGAEIARLAGAARTALLAVDAARAAADELLVRASVVGAGRDPEIAALRPAIDEADAAVAADPTTSPDVSRLEKLVAAARDRVESLERGRAQFPADLAGAATLLDEIEALAARGADELARAQDRIAAPVGLVPALDARASGLRPRLDRIRQQAAGGDPAGAAGALVAWRHEADGWRDRVAAVAKANAAPIARRNELRGLLDAYRAKAVAQGRDEDGRLDRLYDAARGALYTAPCVLADGERLVAEYVTAVNQRNA